MALGSQATLSKRLNMADIMKIEIRKNMPKESRKESRKELKNAKRIVLKVGTSSITYPTGKLNFGKMKQLVREISDLHSQGFEIILVSSGAVGAGIGKLNANPTNIPQKQALAAVGQGLLMHMYEKLFAAYFKNVAQVLLTRDCFSEPLRYLNSRNTIFALLDFGVIPIVNENDTIAVEELKFGDNDTLSAMVACNAEANLLVILSDIDGLYNLDPRSNKDATLISEVRQITQDMLDNSTSKGSAVSSGGMLTKLAASRITMANNIPLVVASSNKKYALSKILKGKDIGTLFVPSRTGYVAKRQWLAVGSKPKGSIFVDEGAAEAILHRGKSLLPKGAIKVEGIFEMGSVISVKNPQGIEIARGICNYDSKEVDKIMGRHSLEIAKILGAMDYEELIHRNNMALV